MNNIERFELENMSKNEMARISNSDNLVTDIAYKVDENNAIILSYITETVDNDEGQEQTINKLIKFSVSDINTKTDIFLFSVGMNELKNISSIFSEIKKCLI